MPLERHQRVANVWNWLPGFRVVAEYQSIQRAALALHVSPSSLSRTIKLLERELGQQLFTRGPSGVSLTVAGRELLAGTRDAMRRIDEELAQPRQRLVVGASGPLLPSFVVGALSPELLARVELVDAAAEELLLRGELDLAVLQQAIETKGLHCAPLGACDWVIAGRPRAGNLVAVAGCEPVECTHRASTLDAARALSAALPAQLVLPRALAESEPALEPLPRRWSLFAAWRREIVDGQSEGVRALTAALARKLSGNVRVDEVV